MSLLPETLLKEFGGSQAQPITRQYDTITLLPAEQLLSQLLLDCRDSMPPRSGSPTLDIWYTGGWVRDKLLGLQSTDIDAALSSMTGVQFGVALENFFRKNETKYRQDAQGLGIPPVFKGLHKTTRRPEKSKHLETCIVHVFGLSVDLVNLREEVYTQDSRNPQMRFTTAKEDAFRRDTTVNALFYNLDRHQIEDFTGKGLSDMDAGVIRTPLDPFQTFMDDPLRVLRVIRFASKLGYKVDDGAKESMKDERIHAALNEKISRERIGIEVVKMMNGPDPLTAFQLIYEAGLYSKVFLKTASRSHQAPLDLLPHQQSEQPWPSSWPRAYRTLAALRGSTTGSGAMLAQAEEKGEYCWTMAAYAPVAELRRTRPQEAVKVMTEAIKATNKMQQLLQDALQHMDDIQSKVDLVATHDGRTGSLPRSVLGMAIRSWGATWKLQVLYSLLAAIVHGASCDGFVSGLLERYSNFVELIIGQKLQDAHLVRPILNGDDVKRLFNLQKGGPFLSLALDGLIRWMFDNADSSKDEAIEWLRSQKDALRIP